MINVLITGAGSCMGQSIYRALKKSTLNFNIHITNSDKLGAGLYFEDVTSHIVPLVKNPLFLEEIKKIVKENKIDIVFSGTQWEIEALSKYGINVATLPLEFLNIGLDKYETSKFFKRNNIKAPNCCLIKDYKNNFPVVIKPKTSSASRNIYIVIDESSIPKNINENYIVQDFLTGEEYTCGCYLDKYSKKINTIIMKRTLTSDGASGYGIVVKNLEIENYVKYIMECFQKEGLEYGHINVQLKLTTEGPICFEINARLSSTEAPKANFGFNSVEAYIYNIVLKQPYDKFNIKDGQFLRYYDEVYF